MLVIYNKDDMQAVAAAAIIKETLGEAATLDPIAKGANTFKSKERNDAVFLGVEPGVGDKFKALFHPHPHAKRLYGASGFTVAKPSYLQDVWDFVRPGSKLNRRWTQLADFYKNGLSDAAEKRYLVVADEINRDPDNFRLLNDNQKDVMAEKIYPKKKAYIDERLATKAAVMIDGVKTMQIRKEESCYCELLEYLRMLPVDQRDGAVAYGVSTMEDGKEVTVVHAYQDQEKGLPDGRLSFKAFYVDFGRNTKTSLKPPANKLLPEAVLPESEKQ